MRLRRWCRNQPLRRVEQAKEGNAERDERDGNCNGDYAGNHHVFDRRRPTFLSVQMNPELEVSHGIVDMSNNRAGQLARRPNRAS